MTKQKLRNGCLEVRKSLKEEEIIIKSTFVHENVLSLLYDLLKDIKAKKNNVESIIIASYAYKDTEVRTKLLNKSLTRDFTIDEVVIKLALPRVDKKRGLIFYKIDDYEQDLERGSYGILEPRLGKTLVVSKEIKIALIPCVGVDLDGNRLGYGQGYYDNFLRVNSHIIKLGLVFGCQILDKIPKEHHDIRMDYIITEDNIYKVRSSTI